MNRRENAEDVMRQMDAVRSHLSTDVQQVASSVRKKTSWRYYLRRYPWACLTGATLVGYLAVPRRIEKIVPDPDMLRKMAKHEDIVVAPKSKASANSGLATQLLTIGLTAAARAAMGVISGKLGETVGQEPAGSESPDTSAPSQSTPRPK